MYKVNGIVYADNQTDEIKIQTVKVLDDMMMLVTFASGEKRLFDAAILLSMPAFKVTWIDNKSQFRLLRMTE